MLTNKMIKKLEWKLSDIASDCAENSNRETDIRLRAYAQGMAHVLRVIGYEVEWDNGKAIVVQDD